MTLPRLRLLHETNPAKYFPALYKLAADDQVTLTGAHRYSVLKEWLRAWRRERVPFGARSRNALADFRFRLSQCSVRDETVVLGFAPWDWRILFYRGLTRHNHVLYHTSWHDWRAEKTPRQPRLAVVRTALQNVWLRFLTDPKVHTIAVTPAVAESLWREWKIAATIIPHAVPELFFEAGASRPSKTNRGLRLLHVGEVSEKKGIGTLLNMMPELAARGVTLSVIGDGPLAPAVQAAGPTVTFHGPIWDRSHLARTMAEHDVLVLLSRRTKGWEELFGIVLVEALAAGLAVIASDHVGPSEVLAQVGNAGLFDEDDTDGIRRRIEALSENPAAAAALHAVQAPAAASYKIGAVSQAWMQQILHENSQLYSRGTSAQPN
ncbi:glycosyltransferase family 4 protein [Pseudoroseicyclus tamaricis]|uniref:Glycosyltransferase n=1 Tax=Pseudoroseicyclus tamaricis TaxID=2705421 RepID=A0A6B2K3Q8_9RHOB|nr:glycosyltransferase [Pseudoroseicyclus tamaricis]NDV01246.1 glycosyltransferase [Pseudoroseicyclus tamaricis]